MRVAWYYISRFSYLFPDLSRAYLGYWKFPVGEFMPQKQKNESISTYVFTQILQIMVS